jgi:hypothetical protein
LDFGCGVFAQVVKKGGQCYPGVLFGWIRKQKTHFCKSEKECGRGSTENKGVNVALFLEGDKKVNSQKMQG